MIKSPFTKTQRKQARLSHKNDKRLNTDWFEAKRVDLAKEIITSPAPNWGGFRFQFLKTAV